jgi:hypothetical protein
MGSRCRKRDVNRSAAKADYFNIVFAVFACPQSHCSHRPVGGPPRVESGSEYDRPQAGGYSSRERANGRVDYSAEHCSQSHQSNVALQKRDQKKSSSRDTDSGPVNQRFGN